MVLIAELQRRWQRLPEGSRQVAMGGAMALSIAVYYFAPTLALPLLGGLLFIVLAYGHLEWGLVFTIFAIPFYLLPRHFGSLSFSAVEFLVLACFAAWLIRSLENGDLRRALSASLTGFGLPALLFVLIGFGSLLVSERLRESVRELRTVILEPVLLYYLLRQARDGRRWILRWSEALLLAAVVVALVGLYQYLFTQDVITAEGVRRIRAVYGSPNNVGLFLGRLVPLAGCLALFAGRRRLLYTLATVVMLLCLVLTFSLGAWLAVLVAAIFIAFVVKGKRAVLPVGMGVAAVALGLLPLAQVERIRSHLQLGEGTTFLRLQLWQAAVNMVKDHPLFGIGLDNFLYRYREHYRLPEAWQEPNISHPHNLILDYWLRLGLPGLIVGVWLLVRFFSRGLRLYRRLNEATLKALMLGLLAGMVDFVVHGMIDNSYFLVDLAMIFWFSLAIVDIMERAQGGSRA
ncbi:MAG: O-antigen ligase family protein [Chloroflexi bacterium]|nr:O-antigen ligase family protein [Chloroflexota bacterium]MCL5074136.1 O-antigen ligase family protein [Chloroflexota bacterium]